MRPSEPNYRGLFVDLLDRVEQAMSCARAGRLHVAPRLGAFEVRIPERPCAALTGTYRVNRASPGFTVEERAITVRELTQARFLSHGPSVVELHFANRSAKVFGDLFNFLDVHPYETGRASAAVAALRTREA